MKTSQKQLIWQDGRLIPWKKAQTHVLTHSLHYGSAVFEGIRAYAVNSSPAIFKLKEHVERLFYSARQLGMVIPFTQEAICQAIIQTVHINRQVEVYIRPLVYYGYGNLKVLPSSALPVHVAIACWPWGDYLPAKAVDITVSEYIRIHPKSTITNAKISGHYVNSILAGLAIQNTHYHESLLLDADGYVAEGSAENIFIVKDGKIFTPPQGTILDGITRATVIQIACDLNIPLEEKPFKPSEIFSADEAFFSGTAVEITPIRSLNDKMIGQNHIGPMTKQISELYQAIIHGKVPKYHHDLTFVSREEK